MTALTARPAPVLHAMNYWLQPSEGFVYDLVRSLRHPGTVVATLPLLNTDRFPYGDLHSLARWTRVVRPRRLRSPVGDVVMATIARRRGVAIVHVHHGYALDRVVPLARRRGLPVVLSLHGHDVTGYLEKRPNAYRDVLDVVSAVVVPSEFLVDLAEGAGFDPKLIRVQPSGIDMSSFSPSPLPDGPPVALFVGRFTAKKGLDVLAAAWPAVQAAVPDARLVLCGYGELEPLARSIPGDVIVVISPDRAQVRAQMRRCRCVVSPSHNAPDDAVESLLVVNVEAQASGRPVVTTRHGAIPEFVAEGESALLVDEHDVDGLAQALVAVLGDEGLARRLGQNGPRVVEHLDMRTTAANIDALYDELLAR
jgi:glycosyltransferase involved in cell wall biosynthesis